MREFDSFDDLTSQDPTDGAIQVMGLPWRVDGRSAEILRDKHGTEFDEVLNAVDEMASGSLDESVLREYGITSAEDLKSLPKDKKEEIARKASKRAPVGDVLETAALLVWAGWVRFEPSLTHEKVLSVIDIQVVTELPIEKMVARLVPSSDESAPDVPAGTEGGERGKSAPTSSSGAAPRRD